MLPLPNLFPPWSTLGRKIESQVRKALYDFSLLQPHPQKLGIALSGGKDSLALLLMLQAVNGRGFPSFELSAFHVEGEFSCGAGVDGVFLERICQKLGVPLRKMVSSQKREELACYSCSRERRRLLFAAAKKEGIETIAFGHHRDDSIQTVLMNLLHKAEFAGNLPKIWMRDYGITIIRPLIYTAEADIRQFAKQQNFLRITCQCPVGQDSMRKKADQLLQEMEEVFPHARANLAKAALVYGSTKALEP